MATEARGRAPSLEEQKRIIDKIRLVIDDVTMEALDKIDPSLGAAIKTIHPENIEFGESLKLRKYLFSGKISMILRTTSDGLFVMETLIMLIVLRNIYLTYTKSTQLKQTQ